MTGKRLQLGVFTSLALVALAGCAQDFTAQNSIATKEAPIWDTLDGKRQIVIAHRGASGYRPEHTLEAYTLAIKLGADIIEPDLVFTKDGVLVVRHDRYLSTSTNVAAHPEFADRKKPNADPDDAPRVDWWVEDFTLAELKTLRARQAFPGRSTEFDGKFEIPTFEEALALIDTKAKEAGRPVGVYPETKHPGYFASIGMDFEAPLLAALENFEAGPVFIQSFEPEILKRLRSKTDAKLVQLVYEEEPGAGPNIPLEAIALYADGVGPAKDLALNPNTTAEYDYIFFAHKLELTVHPWTFRNDVRNATVELLQDTYYLVDTTDKSIKTSQDSAGLEFQLFYLAGADGVFTDFPDTAVAVRDKIEKERAADPVGR